MKSVPTSPAAKPATPAKPSRSTPPRASDGLVKFDLSEEHHARLVDIAQKQGVDVDSLIQAAVDKLLVRLELEPQKPAATFEIRLTPEEAENLQTIVAHTGTDAGQILHKTSMAHIESIANTLRELPETPLLDALTTADCPDYECQVSRPGIQLPTPGLLGAVTISETAALRFLAEVLFNFSEPFMRLCMETLPGCRKDVADALLLAEVIFLRTSGDSLKAITCEGEESRAQLFARWALTGERYVDFEAILQERCALRAAEQAKLDDRRRNILSAKPSVAA